MNGGDDISFMSFQWSRSYVDGASILSRVAFLTAPQRRPHFKGSVPSHIYYLAGASGEPLDPSLTKYKGTECVKRGCLVCVDEL